MKQINDFQLEEILTKDEAAQFLKFSPRSLDYLVATKQIPFSRVGKRKIRFCRSRLLQWLQEREGIEFHVGGERK